MPESPLRARAGASDAQGALPDAPRATVAALVPVTPRNPVAHDVNNMLGVIIGHVGMALRDVRPSDPLRADLVAIQHAAERAAALMRELRNTTASPSPQNAPPSPPEAQTVSGLTATRSDAPPSTPSAAPTVERTVLVVEDEPAILTLVTHILHASGYAVLRATSPTEAISMAHAHTGVIDVLLTDVMMPEMNGRALSRALRETHPGLRTVLMSGYTIDLISAQQVLDPGVSFLQKPFSIDALTAAVHKALRETR